MSVDPTPEPAPGKKKKKKNQKSQLRVVFDTNALYVTPTSLGSASDLLRQEIADLIADAKYPALTSCGISPTWSVTKGNTKCKRRR